MQGGSQEVYAWFDGGQGILGAPSCKLALDWSQLLVGLDAASARPPSTGSDAGGGENWKTASGSGTVAGSWGSVTVAGSLKVPGTAHCGSADRCGATAGNCCIDASNPVSAAVISGAAHCGVTTGIGCDTSSSGAGCCGSCSGTEGKLSLEILGMLLAG